MVVMEFLAGMIIAMEVEIRVAAPTRLASESTEEHIPDIIDMGAMENILILLVVHRIAMDDTIDGIEIG